MSNFGRYQSAQLQTALGQAVAGAQVYFLSQPADTQGLTPQAQIYSSATGGAIDQPLITDGFGQFVAYLAPGVYTVVYVSAIVGTLVYPDQNIALGGGTPGSTTFDQVGSGTNTTAAMVVGSGATLASSGSGSIAATALRAVAVTGTPGTGQVLTATSPTAATWQTAGAGGGVLSLNTLTGTLTLAVGAGLSISQSSSTITISIAVAFTITGFSGGETVELGFSVINPAFTASYSTIPTNANITNTEGIGSPLALTTPFTSGTVIGTFVHTTVETTTFTLSATQGSTQTATQQISWQPRIFGGIGTPGATSSVTASGTTAVLSTSDALPSAGLGAETIGQIIGSYSPSGQAIYLLLTGGSHTFTDNATGFPMAFNAPISVSFVNANGTTVSMFLYASTNPLTGTFVPKIAS